MIAVQEIGKRGIGKGDIMPRRMMYAVAVLGLGLLSGGAQAGMFTDLFAKCLVRSSSIEDQVLITQWMIASLSLNPAMANIVHMTPEQRDTVDRKTADMMQRLLLDSCHNEAVTAIQYEGPGAVRSAFAVFGGVATRQLMGESHVAAGLLNMNTYYDQPRMAELFKGADNVVPDAAPQNSPR